MTYGRDWLEYQPYWSLDDAVCTPLDEFPGDWLEFWGIGSPEKPGHLSDEDWRMANEMHDKARRIAGGAASLQGQGLPRRLRTYPAFLEAEARTETKTRNEVLSQLSELLQSGELDSEFGERWLRSFRNETGESEAKHRLFRTAIQIYSFRTFGLTPGTVERRLLDLLEFLMRANGDRTREYLQRVAFCYIRDMRPEVAVMSRAVLEAALSTDPVEERATINLRIQGSTQRYPGLAGLIQAACDIGAFDEAGRESASFVKDAGDEAVHLVPQQAPDPKLVLDHLRRALTQIEAWEKRQP